MKRYEMKNGFEVVTNYDESNKKMSVVIYKDKQVIGYKNFGYIRPSRNNPKIYSDEFLAIFDLISQLQNNRIAKLKKEFKISNGGDFRHPDIKVDFFRFTLDDETMNQYRELIFDLRDEYKKSCNN